MCFMAYAIQLETSRQLQAPPLVCTLEHVGWERGEKMFLPFVSVPFSVSDCFFQDKMSFVFTFKVLTLTPSRDGAPCFSVNDVNCV